MGISSSYCYCDHCIEERRLESTRMASNDFEWTDLIYSDIDRYTSYDKPIIEEQNEKIAELTNRVNTVVNTNTKLERMLKVQNQHYNSISIDIEASILSKCKSNKGTCLKITDLMGMYESFAHKINSPIQKLYVSEYIAYLQTLGYELVQDKGVICVNNLMVTGKERNDYNKLMQEAYLRIKEREINQNNSYDIQKDNGLPTRTSSIHNTSNTGRLEPTRA